MFFRAFLDILFPPLCHVCKSFIPDAGAMHLCAACRAKIVPVGSPLCTVCGIPFQTENGMDHVCGSCADAPKPFVSARAAVHFAGPAQELIHRLKYGKKVHLSRPLGLLVTHHLTSFIVESGAEMAVPVPLYPARLRKRGFNQALLLAGFLAANLDIPLSRDNLRRIRRTEPQIHLPVGDRVKNVRGAFAVKDPRGFAGKRVLLVDDVYTTGSTVSECARVLKHAGAAEVFVATAARAVIG